LIWHKKDSSARLGHTLIWIIILVCLVSFTSVCVVGVC